MSARAVTIALFAGALGIAALAFHVLRSDESVTRTESSVSEPLPDHGAKASQVAPPDARSGPTRLRAQVATSQAPLAKSRVPSVQPQAQPGPGASAAQTAGNSSHESPSTDPEELERKFAAEAVDPDWGPGMEATIYEQLGEIAGRDLVTVRSECKTTVCRLQVTQHVPVQAGRSADESPRMYEMWEALFARLGFASLPVTSTADANGIVTSVVYLPRGEQEPPR